MGKFVKIKRRIWAIENGAARRAATVLFCGVVEPVAYILWLCVGVPFVVVALPIAFTVKEFCVGVAASIRALGVEIEGVPKWWREWWRVLRVLWRSSESVWLESDEAQRMKSRFSRRVPG